MKKALSLILALVTVIGICCMSANAASLGSYTDVKRGAWYEPAVLTVSFNSIMEGKGNGKFAPNASMTRAELVTVLYRLSEELIFGSEDSLGFKDVKSTAWYAEAVTWAVKSGLATGYPDNTFKPNAPVLRQELAKMFVSFIEYMKITKKATPLVDSFADSARFPDWAAGYIESLRKTGLMGGDDAGKFKPKSNASRAEIATVITRLLPLMVQEDNGDSEGISDYTPAPAPKDFELCTEAEANYPYYIRFPEGYNESEKYPLVIYVAGNADTSISSVGAIFPKEDSPTYDSIVMIPAVGNKSELELIGDTIEYVKDKYSVDTSRVYFIANGIDDAAFFSFKMLEKCPMAVSAYLPILDVVEALFHSGTGSKDYFLEGTYWKTIPEELKDIPLYYIHCTDDYSSHPLLEYNVPPAYGEEFFIALQTDGFVNSKVTITTGAATIYRDFAAREDLAAFDWLFAQRRETK